VQFSFAVVSHEDEENQKASNTSEQTCREGNPQVPSATLQIKYSIRTLERYEQIKLPNGDTQ